jgi:hypothetical protein
MSSRNSENIEKKAAGSKQFPEDVISRTKSLSYEYAYPLSRPYFRAILTNKEPDSNEFARVFMNILRIHIRKELREQKGGINEILKHIRLMEDVDPEKPLNGTVDTPYNKDKFEALENRLQNNEIVSREISKEYLGYIDDLKQGLKEVKDYYTLKGEILHRKLILSRIYECSITKEKCEFGFNNKETVKVSFDNNDFILEFKDLKERAKEIINWLLLAESDIVPQIVTVNNQQKLVLSANWHVNTFDFTVEAIYRILVYYYHTDTNNPLLDFSLQTTPKTGCFIATAAYGSYMAPELELLRSWRDQSLLNSRIGRILVETYYKISPPIAKQVESSEIMKRIVQAMLKPLIQCIKNRTVRMANFGK